MPAKGCSAMINSGGVGVKIGEVGRACFSFAEAFEGRAPGVNSESFREGSLRSR